MASTSASEELARKVLALCLAGRDPAGQAFDELVARAASSVPQESAGASRALFGIVVERLADLFEPVLVDCYVALFARVIERVVPGQDASALVGRYQRVRGVRNFAGPDPAVVYALSRVTLGADVAVTSVILDAAKKRFPHASVVFVGPRKNWRLFEADPRIQLQEFAYGRSGSLRDRLASVPQLDASNAIVIDPDSRFTQLGLLPICPDELYYFFESRAHGGDSDRALPDLAREWCARVFGIDDAKPYVAPAGSDVRADITISLGVGENEEKRVADAIERALLMYLSHTGCSILLDTGAGGSERERVERAADGLPNITLWRGDYAPFAAAIAKSRLYVGYDSAGQHVAAAAGVPLVSIFAGYASDRMFARWRPTGANVRVIKVVDQSQVLRQAVEAIEGFVGRSL